MIGIDLNLDLPVAGDTLSTFVTKTIDALAAIEDSHAVRVTPAGMNINAPLTLGGNAVTQVSSVQFAAGNAPSIAGSIYYLDGDFYAIDAIGTIKLTEDGTLNFSTTGGITGDYGQPGVTAQASYDNASQEFRFTHDAGVYADLVADDVVLMGSAGSVRLGVDAAIAATRTVNFKSLPTANISHLVYDASDNGLKDGAVTRATNTALFTDISVSGEYRHGAREKSLSLMAGYVTGGGAANVVQTGLSVTNNDVGACTWFQDCGLAKGDRVTSVLFYVTKANVVATSYDLFSRDATPTGTSLEATTSTTAGAQVITLTVNPQVTIASEIGNYVRVTLQPGDVIRTVIVVYDRP